MLPYNDNYIFRDKYNQIMLDIIDSYSENKKYVFDLDGVLVDTSIANYGAYKKAMKDLKLGYLSFDDYKSIYGMGYKEAFKKIIKIISNEQLEQLHDRKKEIYLDYFGYIVPNKPLIEFCNRKKAAIWTSASKECSEKLLDYLEIDYMFLINDNDKLNNNFNDSYIIFEDRLDLIESLIKKNILAVRVLS